jgi:hypothetical protein
MKTQSLYASSTFEGLGFLALPAAELAAALEMPALTTQTAEWRAPMNEIHDSGSVGLIGTTGWTPSSNGDEPPFYLPDDGNW